MNLSEVSRFLKPLFSSVCTISKRPANLAVAVLLCQNIREIKIDYDNKRYSKVCIKTLVASLEAVGGLALGNLGGIPGNVIAVTYFFVKTFFLKFYNKNLNQDSYALGESKKRASLVLSEFAEALKNAKIEYSFFGGRKFVLIIEDKEVRFGYNDIIRKYLNLLIEATKALENLKDQGLEQHQEVSLSVRIFKNFPEQIEAINLKAEEARLQHLQSPNISLRERMIHKAFIIHRALFQTPRTAFLLANLTVNLLESGLSLALIAKIHELELNICHEKRELSRLEYNYIKRRMEPGYVEQDPATVFILDNGGNNHGTASEFFDENELSKVRETRYNLADKELALKQMEEQKRLIEQKLISLKKQRADYEKLLANDISKKSQEELLKFDLNEVKDMPSNENLSTILTNLKAAQDGGNLEKVYSLESPFTTQLLKNAKKELLPKLHPDKNQGCERLAEWLFKVIYPISIALSKRAVDFKN